MTAALSLPAGREWTVDDLSGLPNDRRYELINGRPLVTSPIGPHPRHGPVTLTALTLDPATGAYRDPVVATDRFETERPWPVALDLVALTKRWEALHGQAG